MAILARFLLALVVVFATYNPEGVSYVHWLRQGGGPLAVSYIVGLALAGVLSVGLGWAKARQKLTGQVEVD